jgi:hypothetical protein
MSKPLINVSLNLLAYLDGPKSQNPKLREADLSFSMLGMPTGISRTVSVNLAPGETNTVMSTLRALSYTTSNIFVVSNTGATVTISGSFGQRTGRQDGDGTTQWNLSFAQGVITATWTGVGTAPIFAGMVAGDGVTLGAPFSPLNQGDFTLIKVGSNFISWQNQIGISEVQTGQVDVYTSGPVQVGDTIDIQSLQFSAPNRGQFKLTRVTDTFVTFTNPTPYAETVTMVTPGDLNIYKDAYKWVMIAVDQKTIVRYNGDIGSTNEVEPPVPGDIQCFPGLNLKRGRTYQIQLYNPTLYQSQGFVFLAE